MKTRHFPCGATRFKVPNHIFLINKISSKRGKDKQRDSQSPNLPKEVINEEGPHKKIVANEEIEKKERETDSRDDDVLLSFFSFFFKGLCPSLSIV